MKKEDFEMESSKQIKLNQDETQINDCQRLIEGFKIINNTVQKIVFLVQFTEQQEIKYIQNETVIRIEKFKGQINEHEIMKNLEQIKFLSYEGQYGISEQKVKKWNAKWKGQYLKVGGYYNEEGRKIGKWKELHSNYCDTCKIIEQGEYLDGKRIGFWETLLDDFIIGIGIYDNNGNKNGLWKEPYNSFNKNFYILCSGNYREGIKIGKWEYHEKQYHQLKYIGGGQYDENGLKQGDWIELLENYSQKFQVYFQGIYKDGKKQLRWSIFQNKKKIGGGDYDENGLKHGKWTDIHEYFSMNKQFVEIGEYVHGIRSSQFNQKELQ